MTLELNRMASFLFDAEGGKLAAATLDAETESAANREFLNEAAKIGGAPRVSPETAPTLRH